MRRASLYYGRGYLTGKSVKDKTSYDRKLPVWIVHKTGQVERGSLSKSDVLQAFPSVLARDLRTVDDRRRLISELLIRSRALVLKLEHLRVVVDRDVAVIFDGDEKVVEHFARRLAMELTDTMKVVSNQRGVSLCCSLLCGAHAVSKKKKKRGKIFLAWLI